MCIEPSKQQQFLPFQAVQQFRHPYQASNSYKLAHILETLTSAQFVRQLLSQVGRGWGRNEVINQPTTCVTHVCKGYTNPCTFSVQHLGYVQVLLCDLEGKVKVVNVIAL